MSARISRRAASTRKDAGVNLVSQTPRGRAAPVVSVRFWAGARAAAGVDTQQVTAATIAELTTALEQRHPELTSVLPVASLLVDGHAAPPETVLAEGQRVEVLPPFAGG